MTVTFECCRVPRHPVQGPPPRSRSASRGADPAPSGPAAQRRALVALGREPSAQTASTATTSHVSALPAAAPAMAGAANSILFVCVSDPSHTKRTSVWGYTLLAVLASRGEGTQARHVSLGRRGRGTGLWPWYGPRNSAVPPVSIHPPTYVPENDFHNLLFLSFDARQGSSSCTDTAQLPTTPPSRRSSLVRGCCGCLSHARWTCATNLRASSWLEGLRWE